MDILRRSWQEWGKVEDATYPYHSTTGDNLLRVRKMVQLQSAGKRTPHLSGGC